MLNADGILVSAYQELPNDLLEKLHKVGTVTELLRFENNKLLFWEYHYFRITATLRRHRFKIPINYTLDFFETEIKKLVEADKNLENKALITIQFIPFSEGISFLISAEPVQTLKTQNRKADYSLDLFKETGIQAHSLSNLSSTNTTVYTIAERYAFENGLSDCILLNTEKNLVETVQGTLYLFQPSKIITPHLESGCQDFALRAAFNDWLQKNQKWGTLIEQAVNPFELQKSTEVIVLSLTSGAQTVSQYRKTSYQMQIAPPLFRAFFEETC